MVLGVMVMTMVKGIILFGTVGAINHGHHSGFSYNNWMGNDKSRYKNLTKTSRMLWFFFLFLLTIGNNSSKITQASFIISLYIVPCRSVHCASSPLCVSVVRHRCHSFVSSPIGLPFRRRRSFASVGCCRSFTFLNRFPVQGSYLFNNSFTSITDNGVLSLFCSFVPWNLQTHMV
jgi:hypothetical protein